MKKPQDILKQLFNRINERENLNEFILLNDIQENVAIFPDCNRYKSFNFEEFIFKCNFRDCYCCISHELNEFPFHIEKYDNVNNCEVLIGKRFKNSLVYFEEPVHSENAMGIIVVDKLADFSEVFPITKIISKYCRLPLILTQNEYILIPMLHSIN